MRVCDALLFRRGLPLYPVPSAAEGAVGWNAWMAVGFELFAALGPRRASTSTPRPRTLSGSRAARGCALGRLRDLSGRHLLVSLGHRRPTSAPAAATSRARGTASSTSGRRARDGERPGRPHARAARRLRRRYASRRSARHGGAPSLASSSHRWRVLLAGERLLARSLSRLTVYGAGGLMQRSRRSPPITTGHGRTPPTGPRSAPTSSAPCSRGRLAELRAPAHPPASPSSAAGPAPRPPASEPLPRLRQGRGAQGAAEATDANLVVRGLVPPSASLATALGLPVLDRTAVILDMLAGPPAPRRARRRSS